MDVYQRHLGVFNYTLASATQSVCCVSLARQCVNQQSTPTVDDVNKCKFFSDKQVSDRLNVYVCDYLFY